MADPGRPDRRTFGRVVLLGLAAAGLAALGGHRPWVGVHADDDRAQSLAVAAVQGGAAVAESPAAGALALVVLACWGVLLVTRRRVRRVVAGLALLASLALCVAVVAGWGDVADAVRRTVGDVGGPVEVSHGAWFWVTAIGALLSVVGTAAAVRLVPTWPEMGTRYDAPTAGSPPVTTSASAESGAEEPSSIDLWKAIEEGRDPTT